MIAARPPGRAALVAALLGCSAAPAAGASIGARPVIIEAELPAGAREERFVTIRNDAGEPLRFDTEVFDLGLDASGSQARLAPGTRAGSMAAWLSIQPETFVVPAAGERQVAFVLAVPRDASGGHQAAVLFSTVANVSDGERPFRVGAGIAVKVFHATTDRSERRLELIETRVEPPAAREPLAVRMLLRNAGNAFLRGRAEVALLDEARRQVGRAVSEPTSVLIPGQTAELSVEWAGELSPGRYTARTTLVHTGGGSVAVEDGFVVVEPPLSRRGAVPTSGESGGALEARALRAQP